MYMAAEYHHSSQVSCAVKMERVAFLGFVLFTIIGTNAQFNIPTVTLEAYSPKGFRAYIPDISGIRQFNFNGKINNHIAPSEPGEIVGEVRTPTDGKWVYSSPDLQLEVGDKINYWVFIQHDRLGYRKDSLTYEVKELLSNDALQCERSISVLSGGPKTCKGKVFLEDEFVGAAIDTDKWIVEHYIPTYFEANYEFFSYQNVFATRSVRESILMLKPVPMPDESNLRGKLDLSQGCTRPDAKKCVFQHFAAQRLPAGTSGKITSKSAFKYGRIEIRAKLPAGDWIFPQIELIPKTPGEAYPKVLLAYARGNERLTSGSDEIGSTILFGGPVLNYTEPERSRNLRSKKQTSSFSSDYHIYTVLWNTDKLEFSIDGSVYGTVFINNNDFGAFHNEYRLSLGVGVGGIVDFPEGYVSGTSVKPWRNGDFKQITDFFKGKTQWISTWNGDNVALQVDYVKITAI